MLKGCRPGFSLCAFDLDTDSTRCCNDATQICNYEEGFCMAKPHGNPSSNATGGASSGEQVQPQE